MDMTEQAKALAEIMREYLAVQLQGMAGEIDTLRRENDDLRARNAEIIGKLADFEEKIAKLPAPRYGKDGENGKDGVAGEKGADGKDGRDGRDGRDGKDGQDGRDAAQIDILPAIDEEKTYAKGTFASHKGGLWRAKTTTSGMDGWELVCDGISGIDIAQGADRTVVIQCTKASGTAQNFTLNLPSLIYKGVYSAQIIYAKGDMVTFGGGVWHCDGEAEGKPGEAKGWTLAVKKGRDGKDGDKGDRGEKGEKGRDGRDLTQMGMDGNKW